MSAINESGPESQEGAGIPHALGVETRPLTVSAGGQSVVIHVPANHDGSRVKIELPDGQTAYSEGFDPAERALAGGRPTVPCANCAVPQVLTSESFVCSACGARNTIALQTSADSAAGSTSEY